MIDIKIGIDYDEPMHPWYAGAHRASVEAGLHPEDGPMPTSWAPHETYGCSLEDWVAVLDAQVMRDDHGFYGDPLIPSAVEAVRRAYTIGYEIHFVTARGSFGVNAERVKRITQMQVMRENVPHTSLRFARDKFKAIRDLGLHYFLDDRPKHFEEALAAGADTFLLAAPWNEDFQPFVRKDRVVKSTEEYINRILDIHGAERPKLTPAQRAHIAGAHLVP